MEWNEKKTGKGTTQNWETSTSTHKIEMDSFDDDALQSPFKEQFELFGADKEEREGEKKNREIGFVYIDNGDECFKSKWQFIRQTYSRAIDMIDKTIHHIERLFDFHIADDTQWYLSDVSTLFSN